nr:hypothetical protein HK105_006208 [Polyrhizophydium stewartii]
MPAGASGTTDDVGSTPESTPDAPGPRDWTPLRGLFYPSCGVCRAKLSLDVQAAACPDTDAQGPHRSGAGGDTGGGKDAAGDASAGRRRWQAVWTCSKCRAMTHARTSAVSQRYRLEMLAAVTPAVHGSRASGPGKPPAAARAASETAAGMRVVKLVVFGSTVDVLVGMSATELNAAIHTSPMRSGRLPTPREREARLAAVMHGLESVLSAVPLGVRVPLADWRAASSKPMPRGRVAELVALDMWPLFGPAAAVRDGIPWLWPGSGSKSAKSEAATAVTRNSSSSKDVEQEEWDLDPRLVDALDSLELTQTQKTQKTQALPPKAVLFNLAPRVAALFDDAAKTAAATVSSRDILDQIAIIDDEDADGGSGSDEDTDAAVPSTSRTDKKPATQVKDDDDDDSQDEDAGFRGVLTLADLDAALTQRHQQRLALTQTQLKTQQPQQSHGELDIVRELLAGLTVDDFGDFESSDDDADNAGADDAGADGHARSSEQVQDANPTAADAHKVRAKDPEAAKSDEWFNSLDDLAVVLEELGLEMPSYHPLAR